MAYNLKFIPDELVRVADRATLDKYFRSYKLHHPLQAAQLDYAGRTAYVMAPCSSKQRYCPFQVGVIRGMSVEAG